MNTELVRKILQYVRWDGEAHNPIRFLTMEDGGGLGEEQLGSLQAFDKHFSQEFEYWKPGESVEKGLPGRVISKVMTVLCGNDISTWEEYRKQLYRTGRESNIKFYPVSRRSADWWNDRITEYTGLGPKQYDELCWLARPRILGNKLKAVGEPKKYYYIILYREWDWMQCLRMIFEDIDFLATKTAWKNEEGSGPIHYRFYYDSQGKQIFACLPIRALSEETIKKFCDEISPDVRSRLECRKGQGGDRPGQA